MNRQADGKRRKEIQPSSPAIERGCEKDSRGQIGRTKKKKEGKRTREKEEKRKRICESEVGKPLGKQKTSIKVSQTNAPYQKSRVESGGGLGGEIQRSLLVAGEKIENVEDTWINGKRW